MKLYSIKRIWAPDIYQGGSKKKNYFEGWYFKLVDRHSENILAVIPSVSFGPTISSGKAMIQVLLGSSHTSYEFQYPIATFLYSKQSFKIFIDSNYFSSNLLRINLCSEGLSLKGELKFSNLIPWPVRNLSPGAMGWFGLLPFMECYHAVISFSHEISGSLWLNGKEIDFTGGKGYIEKDYGCSFPSKWIWLQSNHFSKEGTSIMCSVAAIPFLLSNFTGFICGLHYDNKFKIFATYSGAKILCVKSTNNKIQIILRDKYFELLIKGEAKDFGKLTSPAKGVMSGNDLESLSGDLEIQLFKLLGSEKFLVYKDCSKCSSIEIMGSF